MPLYDYTCPAGHEFELKAGFNDEWIDCEWCYCAIAAGDRDPELGVLKAHRVQVYYDQSVHFKGAGFTRAVVPPPPPGPPVTAKLNTTDALEVQNDFVEADYAHTQNYREQAKEDAKAHRPEAID